MAIKIKCHNCSYVWLYRGKQMFYCSCPRCMYKVNISKNLLNYKVKVGKNDEQE